MVKTRTQKAKEQVRPENANPEPEDIKAHQPFKRAIKKRISPERRAEINRLNNARVKKSRAKNGRDLGSENKKRRD